MLGAAKFYIANLWLIVQYLKSWLAVPTGGGFMSKVLNSIVVDALGVADYRSTLAKLLLVLGVGMALFYLVGMSQYPAVHEAFHDVRHAAGFPCH